jgi:cathepsin B
MSNADAAKRAKAIVAQRTKKKEKTSTTETVKQAAIICAVSMVVAFCLLYLSPPKGTYETEVNNPSRIEQINQISKVWTAGENKAFEGMSIGDVRDLGPINFRSPDAQWHLCPNPGTGDAPPQTFDVREQWPDCFPDYVYNQGNCSASYAIAAASAVSNRYCIQDPVNFKMFQLSPQSILSCHTDSDGCFGGGMDTVWSHLLEDGIVSEMCFPFQGADGTCSDACDDEEPVKIVQKCIAQREDAIKAEVFANGPVVAPMRLTDELLLYKSGVFIPTRTAIAVGEKRNPKQKKMVMVKIMGWGVEDETPYWLIEGVFGKEWGEGGFAKIAFPEEETDPSGQGNPNEVIATDFTFVGIPANMRFGGAPDEFDDINFEDGAGDDVSFDDDVEFDDDEALVDED